MIWIGDRRATTIEQVDTEVAAGRYCNIQCVTHHWRITVDLTPGEHEILVRAWDSSAATQPEDEAALWNPKGYVNNARPRVRVRATAA